LVLLFGSFARGAATNRSDVDIAISGQVAIPHEALGQMALELSDELRREVDLIDLSESFGSSLEEPMLKGTILVNKDLSVREKLMNRMIRQYEDDRRVNDTIFKERLRLWKK
jgi:predicted nucleotidyltransferase